MTDSRQKVRKREQQNKTVFQTGTARKCVRVCWNRSQCQVSGRADGDLLMVTFRDKVKSMHTNSSRID